MSVLKEVGLTVLLSAALLSCSSSNNSSPPVPSVPERLQFVPQSGPPLSQQDLAELKIQLKDQIADVPSTLMIKKKNDSAKWRQNQRMARLSTPFQSALLKANNLCNITEPAEQKSGDIDPEHGQNHEVFTKTASISGGQCPISYSKNTQTNLDVATINKDQHFGVLTGKLSVTSTESVSDKTLQTYSNFVSGHEEIQADYVFKITQDAFRAYGKSHFSTSAETLKRGLSSVEGTVELLGNLDQSGKSWIGGEASFHFSFKNSPIPLNVSAHTNRFSSSQAVFTVYLNGQQLDSETSVIVLKAGGFQDSEVTSNGDGTVSVWGLEPNED